MMSIQVIDKRKRGRNGIGVLRRCQQGIDLCGHFLTVAESLVGAVQWDGMNTCPQ